MNFNRKIAAALVAVSILAGVGAGLLIQRLNNDDATASPNPNETVTTAPVDEETPVAEETTEEPAGNFIAPGRMGPITVGDSVDDLVAQGIVTTDDDRCEGSTYYRWADEELHLSGMDIIESEGLVTAMGTGKERVWTTSAGAGFGTTYEDLKEMYGESLTAPQMRGYNQTGIYLQNDQGWLGFLFDPAPEALTDDSTVSFMEVTKDAEPGLMRDGC